MGLIQLSVYLSEAKLKLIWYRDALSNTADTESSVPVKAHYYSSYSVLSGDRSNCMLESDSDLKMFRHTLTQRKLKPKAPGLSPSYLKIKGTSSSQGILADCSLTIHLL